MESENLAMDTKHERNHDERIEDKSIPSSGSIDDANVDSPENWTEQEEKKIVYVYFA